MPKPSKARRSFRVVEEDVADDEPNEDFGDELRTRRSINRVEDGPVFKSPSKQTKEVEGSVTSTNFFHCLKMAADNKINVKNAFTLQMIDYLNEHVYQQDSALSKNFQLATCSLDAGTKIYAARVDCVAKDMTDFSMVMTMANKKDGGDGGGVEDEDANTVEAKRKKIKKLRRGKIFAKSMKELQLDFTKLPQIESVFPLVGNLMHESIDSFSFTDRGSNGAIPELMPSALETSEPDKPMKIKIPKTGDLGLCPTLEKFVMGFELSEEANDMLNASITSMTDTPNLSLKEFNESSLEDNPPPEPMNRSFDASVMEEGVDAYGGDGYREADLVADRTPSLLGPMAPKKVMHDGRIIQLQGPAYWKYKKPTNPEMNLRKVVVKKVKAKHEPLDFTQVVDLKDLLKKKTKVTLKRETLLKWSTDKITLPFEIFEGDAHSYDMTLDIRKFSLMPTLLIPNVEALEATPLEQGDGDAPTDDFFNDEQFPLQNDVDHPDDDDSDDEHPLAPIGDDGDAETFNQDLQNLFNSNLMDSTRASFMTNIGLDESKLISAPQVIETVLPEWKPARRFNMKKLEQTLWERLEEEQGTKPSLHQLYEGLPDSTQKSASVTTVLYALLNVCNKKGVVVSASNEQLQDCKVQMLQRRKSTPHPAIRSPHD